MTRLRCLNEHGVREFERYLVRARDDRSVAPPYHLLESPRSSAAFVLGEVEIEQRAFTDRREFAEYMDARFVEAGIDEDVDVDGVWEWLTLYYFDTTCPVRGDGRRVKKPNRYVLNPSSEVDPRRHLLRNAYLVHRRMGLRDPRAVDLIMSQRVDDYAKVITHISERRTIRDSRGALHAARELYFDAAHGRTKRNISDTEIGVQAFGAFLVNLPHEYDLTTLSSTTILALLPDGFDDWIEDEERRRQIAELRRRMEEGGIHAGSSGEGATSTNRSLLTDRDLKLMPRRVRDDLFRIEVLRAYDGRCAVSRLGITYSPRSGSVRREVEAAHIIPVARGGGDVVVNGLALNRTVHWAFDQGMIWIDDDFRIVITRETMKDERNEWLSTHHGRQLSLPSDPELSPNRDALRWHARHVAEAV